VVHPAVVIAATEPDLPRWLAGPLGPDAVITGGERLRRWALSEVWRVQLGGPVPRSVIVKRGTGEMSGEARRYRQLVGPLAAPAPDVISLSGGHPVVLVLADVGRDTLEQHPTAEGYREAVRMLARMRAVAARRLAAEPAIGTGLRWATADFADAAGRAGAGLAALRPDLTDTLAAPARVLAERLREAAGEPETLVHGDYHAKNIIHAGDGRMVAVDWPHAYVHAHLGDLYCLLREARKRGLTDAAGLPEVFAAAAGTDPATVADQLVTGGLCWTLTTLRWLVEEGVHAVPESRNWIDELVTECRQLAGAGRHRGR
jgi:streptomycin 6-kinase